MPRFTTDNSDLSSLFLAREEDTEQTLEIQSLLPEQRSINGPMDKKEVDLNIPSYAQESYIQAQAIEKKNLEAKRKEVDELINLVKSSQNIISDANENLDYINENPISSDILGIFDDKYNTKTQLSTQAKARRDVQQKVTLNNLAAHKRNLDLKSAQAGFSHYEKLLNVKARELNITNAEASLAASSVRMQKANAELLFNKMTHNDIVSRAKRGDYDDVFTPGAYRDYSAGLKKAARDARSKEIAIKSGEIQLANDLEKDLLDTVPAQYMKDKMLQAIESKSQVVELFPDKFVTLDKVRLSLADKEEKQKKARETMAKTAIDQAKTGVELTNVLSTVQGLSNSTSGSDSLVHLAGYNILNITEESMNQIDYSAIHPALQLETIDVMRRSANINTREDEGFSVTPEEIAERDEAVKVLKAKADALKEVKIKQASDTLKPAVSEWLTDGRVSGAHAATVLMENLAVIPDYKGDNALEAAHKVFAENSLKEITGEEINFEENPELLLSSLGQAANKSKLKTEEKILKVMNMKNADNLTPAGAYALTKGNEVMDVALTKLAERYPELRNKIMVKDFNPSFINISKVLAQASAELIQKNPNLEPNVLNQEMFVELNNLIADNAQIWNSQITMERGSLMALIFKNKRPHQLVDNFLDNAFAQYADQSWNQVIGNENDARNTVPAFEKLQGGFGTGGL